MAVDFSEDMHTDSTVIDEGIDPVKSGGGKPPVEEQPKPEVRKPESARESLEAEAKKLASTKDEDDGDDEPKQDKKPVEAKDAEPKPEVKKSEAEAKEGTEQEAKTPKPSEGRKIIEAPARFLPRAKDLWQNVPHPVREEWVRAEQERETEVAQHREAKAFRDELAEYEGMAKQSGTTVKDALGNYVRMEQTLRSDPATGFRALLQNMNMHPTQAIGHIMQAAGVTPQQLVEHMQREPHAYTSLAQPRQMPQQQAQERVVDPEVSALKQEVEAMRAERVANDVIRPFAQEYPEYFDNEEAIAKVLQSGIIEQIHGKSLSPRDKLEAALFMVAPNIRRGFTDQSEDRGSVLSEANENAPAVDLRGGKSVKSSVGGVSDTSEPNRKMSMRDMLEEEARKLTRRA